ncbi:insulin-like growth factor II [Mya arenaria]|uniref:insulin-like growth factor II n=1 Tax=Mya arenaria TaxID=6604 RepID=UPI0022DF52E7|nr:insulin-like growth factor II [Mya arenaria]XP_052809385.1 insulin-like growth factor II [Mya arenaria]
MWQTIVTLILTVLTDAITEAAQVQFVGCGSNLDTMLRLVCQDRGFNGIQKKRNIGFTRHGIVEECCHQPCSLGQLEQYCAVEGTVDTEEVLTNLKALTLHRQTLPTIERPSPIEEEVLSSETNEHLPTSNPWTMLAQTGQSHVYRNGPRTRFFYVRRLNPSPTRSPVIPAIDQQ